jgi:hypothetical protein
MNVDGADVQAQYGCINFQVKCYGGHGAKLTLAVKNKWPVGWTRVWFYCKVSLLWSPRPVRSKSVYALRSSMAPLEFSTESSFEYTNDDFGDDAFVRATGLIGGRDAVEEYLACTFC